jgi:hypothetical protein
MISCECEKNYDNNAIQLIYLAFIIIIIIVITELQMGCPHGGSVNTV